MRVQGIKNSDGAETVSVPVARYGFAQSEARHLVHGPGARQVAAVRSRDVARIMTNELFCGAKHLVIDVVARLRRVTGGSVGCYELGKRLVQLGGYLGRNLGACLDR